DPGQSQVEEVARRTGAAAPRVQARKLRIPGGGLRVGEHGALEVIERRAEVKAGRRNAAGEHERVRVARRARDELLGRAPRRVEIAALERGESLLQTQAGSRRLRTVSSSPRQSPGLGWRRSVTLGYQTERSPLSPQRHSAR